MYLVEVASDGGLPAGGLVVFVPGEGVVPGGELLGEGVPEGGESLGEAAIQFENIQTMISKKIHIIRSRLNIGKAKFHFQDQMHHI